MVGKVQTFVAHWSLLPKPYQKKLGVLGSYPRVRVQKVVNNSCAWFAKTTLPAPWQFHAIFMKEELGLKVITGDPRVHGVLTVDRILHWYLAIAVFIQYIDSSSPSLAQCMTDTMYGRLGLENIIIYNFGSSSLSAMFISLKLRKRKMTAGRHSGDSTLAELSWTFRCLTGGATWDATGAWYGCTECRTLTWPLLNLRGLFYGGGSRWSGRLGDWVIGFHAIAAHECTGMRT